MDDVAICTHGLHKHFGTTIAVADLTARGLDPWAADNLVTYLHDAEVDALVGACLASLRRLFGRVPAPDEICMHDWRADPWASGAYSYVLVGGAGAREALAQPLHGTLFFAGEAANLEGEAGTVGGALQSGQRAARELIGCG